MVYDQNSGPAIKVHCFTAESKVGPASNAGGAHIVGPIVGKRNSA